jgi:hypothetical protein
MISGFYKGQDNISRTYDSGSLYIIKNGPDHLRTECPIGDMWRNHGIMIDWSDLDRTITLTKYVKGIKEWKMNLFFELKLVKFHGMGTSISYSAERTSFYKCPNVDPRQIERTGLFFDAHTSGAFNMNFCLALVGEDRDIVREILKALPR